MSGPEQPKNKGHRFQKGHKFGGGRPKGAIGKKTLREKLLNGLAKSGAKKALKAGHNNKVDGFEYFIEDLANSNSSAAASLASKLIALEPPPVVSGSYTPPAFNITSIESDAFLTEKQIAHQREHNHLPPGDDKSHSAGAVKFHNKHGRYPTDEELVATASASNNGFDDVKVHYSPEPIFTPDYAEQKVVHVKPDDGNVISMPDRRAQTEADRACREFLASLADDGELRTRYLNTLNSKQLARLAGVDENDVEEG